MTSLLRPIALESCQTTLRERRRSSIHPLAAVPRLFLTGPSSSQEECAITDDNDKFDPNDSPAFVSPTLASLTHAQLPDHASKITILRHFDSPPPTPYDLCTPSSSAPPTAVPSRKASVTTLIEETTPDYSEMERLKWRLASGFFAYFLCGWGDSVTGTILPHFMAEFQVSYTLSSLLYAGSTTGYLFGTFLVELIINYLSQFNLAKTCWSWFPASILFSPKHTQKKLGFSPSQGRLLTLLFSSTVHAMFFVMMGSKNGYWVLFFAYVVAAFARSILTASLNAYLASGPQQSLGYAYGLWSLGGVASPLVCQVLISKGVPWNHFYLGSLVLSVMNTTFLVLTFMPTAAEFLRDRTTAILASKPPSSGNTTSTHYTEHKSPTKVTTKDGTTLRIALTLPYLWAISIFSLLYCGCETSTQAFMVSYLRGIRNANPKTAGYVTSGFWGGITVGRLVWGHYTPKLTYTQRKWVIEGCIGKKVLHRSQTASHFFVAVMGLIMQILIWTVNSNVQNAFATGVIGLVFGPVFPAILTLANDILPSEVRMVSMALISAAASFGAALFPFFTGLLSTMKGVHTLTYITVPLAGAITFLWALFPSRVPRRKSAA
ncbi:unnamed protein product [Cyclocybe aegerita]|uniref:Major facilitator superfamily (MFS) profile domain-containing protein n=1 Tax=Cyclocybe aegerita TaxID=1973307 RepID=A0A8S0WC70_CYCAE|nr:unnamed protein product [Cyclocybe aegerita]